MTPLAQAISAALIQFVWQGFVASLFVSALLFLSRKRGAEVRYALCCVALLVLALLPLVTAIVEYDPFAGKEAGRAAVTLTIRAAWRGAVPSAAHWLNASQPWILRVWIIGVAFLSLRLAWLGVRISALRRSANAVEAMIAAIANDLARRMGTSRMVRVLVFHNPRWAERDWVGTSGDPPARRHHPSADPGSAGSYSGSRNCALGPLRRCGEYRAIAD